MSTTTAIWQGFAPVEGTPAGFTLRGTLPRHAGGVEVMLERWEAGTAEPPHAHPGDDMTVVVEGHMRVQFFRRTPGGLVPDGPPVELRTGQTGYVEAGRIHDATYVEACKLVYVHDGEFAFHAAG